MSKRNTYLKFTDSNRNGALSSPLPTTAGFDGDYQRIIDRAVQDAVTLEKAGVDAVIVENMGIHLFPLFK